MAMNEDWMEVERSTLETTPMTVTGQQAKSTSTKWVFNTAQKDSSATIQEPLTLKHSAIPNIDLKNLYNSMQSTGAVRINTNQPVFRVNAKLDLATAFLSELDEDCMAQMNCNTCRKFLNRYGGLCLVNSLTGQLIPLFWHEEMLDDNNIFLDSVISCAGIVQNEQAVEEFLVTKNNLEIGTKEAGGYEHMCFQFPSSRIHKAPPRGFGPSSASECARMLDQVLQDFDHHTVQKAARMVLEDKLPYVSEHKAAIRWLKDIWDSKKIDRATNKVYRNNLLLHHAASSFSGCIKQLRSGALSVLLKMVSEQASFPEIEQQWTNIAGPASYMRPSAAPSEGQVNAAERLFKALELTDDDMRRQYATSEDIPSNAFIYKADPMQPEPGSGVFGNLKTKSNRSTPTTQQDQTHDDLPATSMSFVKFVEQVVPEAKSIDLLLPGTIYMYFFIKGLPNRKSLMQWHNETNNVSWYTWLSGIKLPALGVSQGWAKVESIVPFPHLWLDMEADSAHRIPRTNAEMQRFRHNRHGIQYLVQLNGALETSNPGLCLFPTFLKSEFHGIRSTLEVYSKNGTIEPPLNSSGISREYFAGVSFGSNPSAGEAKQEFTFRVQDENGEQGTYKIVTFA